MTDPFKVNFMIVGAQKCGTSTLSEILRTHPSLVRCDEKEPDFFSASQDWQAELPRYEEMFQRRKGACYYEASPSYTFYPHRKLELWNDLYEYNPNLKIVYVVRNPIDRITSSYMHSYERGYTDLPFERALIKVPVFFDVTRYATQITPFIERFGRERVSILFFEDLARDPNGFVRSLAAFLGIDPEEFGDAATIHVNRSLGGHKRHHKYDNPGILLSGARRLAPPIWRAITSNSARAFDRKPLVSPPLRRMMLRILGPEIDRLEEITGRDLRHWREVPLAEDAAADSLQPSRSA